MATSTANKATYIHTYIHYATTFRLEIQELSSECVAQFNNVGVTTQLATMVKETIPMLTKREIYELSDTRISLSVEEDIASDVFSYKLLEKADGTSARFTLPLFDKSFSSRQEVVVKNGLGHVILPKEVKTGKDVR